MPIKNINIFTDGGSRGNPGPAAVGVYIEGDGKVLAQIGKRIGENTNNFAEYSAVLQALDFLLQNIDLLDESSKINFFMDSQLIYSQIVGLYKIKSKSLSELLFKVKEKEKTLRISVSYSYIPREQNKKADKLVNMALDNLV